MRWYHKHIDEPEALKSLFIHWKIVKPALIPLESIQRMTISDSVLDFAIDRLPDINPIVYC